MNNIYANDHYRIRVHTTGVCKIQAWFDDGWNDIHTGGGEQEEPAIETKLYDNKEEAKRVFKRLTALAYDREWYTLIEIKKD